MSKQISFLWLLLSSSKYFDKVCAQERKSRVLKNKEAIILNKLSEMSCNESISKQSKVKSKTPLWKQKKQFAAFLTQWFVKKVKYFFLLPFVVFFIKSVMNFNAVKFIIIFIPLSSSVTSFPIIKERRATKISSSIGMILKVFNKFS